ncbi:hypothetical protein FQR65_LT19914 [Abscondita terminalis]|nr:hypothetical protein FQR65_LT19914 [Abscondita terminalis]
MLDICNKEELLKVLKCNQCSKILSVLPVYYSPGTGIVCGRCVDVSDPSIKDNNAQRAVAYEAVAQFLLFPCSNYRHGCEVKLECDKIKQHEEKCQFSLFPCPFNEELGKNSIKCDWTGIKSNLTEHLHDRHNDRFQTDLINFHLNVDFTYVKMFFTVIYNITFLVITQFIQSTKKFYCIVVCCENSIDHRSFRYKLKLGRSNYYLLTLHKPETQPFINVGDVVNKKENMIVADVAALRDFSNDSNDLIYYKICIKKNTNMIVNQENLQTLPASNTSQMENSTPFGGSESEIDKQWNQKSAYGDTLLNEIECPVCNEYMTPPIFICPMGHSICSSCRPKIRICPSCRSEIQDTRNFTLEKLTTVFEYPCKHQEFGCNLRLNHKEIELHQQHCSYGFKECPWKLFGWCKDEEIVDLIGHIRNKHASFLIKTNHNYSIRVGITTALYAAITPENELLIIFCDGAEQLKINFIHVINRGINKTKSTYKYKLEFCDKTGGNLEFIISKLCQIIQPIDRSSAFKKCLSIPQEMIEPFIIKNPVPKVIVKFHIEKI